MFAWFGVARAATLTVDPSGGGDFTTIQGAIRAAESGDTLEVAPGTYTEQLALLGPDLTIVATGGPEVTSIEDGDGLWVIQIESGAITLEGFSVTSHGARQCLRVRGGSLTLRGSVVHDCGSTGLGGAMRLEVGTRAVIETTEFRDNHVTETDIGQRGGHVYSRADSLEVRDSTFTGGTSETDAAGLALLVGDLLFERNHFEGQVAARHGGAIQVDGAPRTFEDGTVGTGVRSAVFLDNTFAGNVAGGAGGAVWLVDVPSYTFERNLFCANDAGTRGGAVFVGTSVAGSFSRDVVQENTAAEGGGLFLEAGQPTIDGVDLLGNAGGAVVAEGAEVALTNTVIAWTTGEGVLIHPTAQLTSSWNGYWQNEPADLTGADPGDGDVSGDPWFVELTRDGDCTNDDLTPFVEYIHEPYHVWNPPAVHGSPLIDAGDPDAELDEDGSRRDIGAFAWTRPPYVEPTPIPVDEGCGCAQGGPAAGGWALLLLGVLVRRRRAA